MTRSTAPAFPVALVLALALGVSACGGDGTGPDGIERSDVVGSYEATTFTTTQDGDTTDQLAQGAEFTIELDGDGTTTGQLFVPDGGEEGGDLDESLDGTWTFDSGSGMVEFDQSADTFVRDMTFSAVGVGGGVRLEGEETFGDGVTIEVVLE